MVPTSFNSLQTGKYIQSSLRGRNWEERARRCFNSLQTGKYIQSSRRIFFMKIIWLCFNSLQTGKYIQRPYPPTATGSRSRFNSLQTGKYIQRKSIKHFGRYKRTRFQFPSNGKVYPKENGELNWFGIRQLPFQFPSNGKVYPKSGDATDQVIFEMAFQFPSNGKVYPKGR